MTVDIPGVGDDIEFPDTMTPAEVAAAAGRLHQQASAPARPGLPSTEALARRVTASAPAVSSAFTSPELPPMRGAGQGDGMRGALRTGVNAIPTALAIGGEWAGGLGGAALGALAGPAAPAAIPAAAYGGKVAGGAAGGYVGQVARNAIAGSPAGDALGLRKPASLTEGAGREAMVQGGASAVGVPLGAAVGKVGGVLTGKTMARAAATTEDVARSSGFKIAPQDVLAGLSDLENEAKLMGAKQVKALAKLKDDFLANKAVDLTAHQLHQLRQAADNVAQQIFKARETGQVIGPKMALKGRFWENVGNTVRGILKDQVPKYREAVGQVEKAIGSKSRVPRVSEGPIRGTLTNPFGVPELATRAVMGAKALKLYGRVAEHSTTRALASQAPRAAAFGLGAAADRDQTLEPGLWDMQDLDTQPPPDSIMVSGHWRKLPGRR